MFQNMSRPSAEELVKLTSYLTARESGIQPATGEPGFPSGLAGELIKLAESIEPDPEFAARLELQISQADKTGAKVSRHGWLLALWQSFNQSERKTTMKRLVAFALTGVILFVILWVAIPSLFPSPTQTQFVVAPSTNTPVPSPISPLTPTVVPPTPLHPVVINFTPQPIPDQPPVLPPLVEALGAAYGGSGVGNLPEDIPITLATELPASPAEVTAYYRLENAPLTLEKARQIAGKWGLEAQFYIPEWMQSVSADEKERSYYAIDGMQELSMWNDEVWYSLTSLPSYGGHQYPQTGLPSPELAITTATQFLTERGFLNYPYQINLKNYEYGYIDFLRLLDDLPINYHTASVKVNQQGQVENALVRPEEYHAVGTYPALSAQQAWNVLLTGQPGDQLTKSYQPTQDGNPQYWGRIYPPGQVAHLFGSPVYLLPAEAGGTPYIQLGNLVLAGDLSDLLEYLQEKTLYNTPQGYVHIWGEVQEVDGSLQLQLTGWEPFDEFSGYFDGTVRRNSEGDFLELSDGRKLVLPELPEDVPADIPLYAEGGLVGETLEWFILQVHPVSEGQMPPDLSQAQVVIDKVELVYLAPALNAFPPGTALEPAYRMLIPAWSFSGQIINVGGGDLAFQAYVQAVINP